MPDIISPIDGEVAFRYACLDVDQALAVLERAESAQRSWSTTSIGDRVALCLRMLECYEAHAADHAAEITRMMGKPIRQARGEFSGGMRERTEHLCKLAPKALLDHVLPEKPGLRRWIRHEPVGVVLDIAAWNYPLLIATNVVIPAVLAGNAVVIKHAHQTALVGRQLERVFREAGAPEGLVADLAADHSTVAELIHTRRFGYVAFTGSVRGGHEVARTVAEHNFVGAAFELGGKDAALVLPDAPFEHTVESLVDGAYYNAGQSCCGIERIYVHRDIYDRFVEAFAAKVLEYRLGDPLDESVTLGPVVHAEAAQTIREQIDAARAAGARDIVDPGAFDVPDRSSCYMAPTALVDVDHSMALMQRETFGPTVGIMRVQDEDEGIRFVNDSAYGLTGSVWTSDADRGERIARRIEAGTVYLNRCDYLDPGLAWSGVKDSGVGGSLSVFGFHAVTRRKSFNFRTEV